MESNRGSGARLTRRFAAACWAVYTSIVRVPNNKDKSKQ